MANILVVFGTSYGQTGKIVQRIAHSLTARGHRVTLWKGDELPVGYSLDGFDGFLIAGSVLYGKHQRYLGDFVRRHLARLSASPSAFVSVCGAIMGSWPPGPEAARKYVAKFLAETGWTPRLTRSFAGELSYTRYGVFIRWVMRYISRRTGRPTDTSRDWEFTDWDAVDQFAAELAGTMGEKVVAAAVW
jgi:menaquinone-dependent protoporphyrinogen oxidase